MTQAIEPYQPKEIAPAVEAFSGELTAYLGGLGLPKEAVLTTTDQRRVVINNIPTVLALLTPQQRLDSMYISKFVAACAVGLFDAALNYLWDETVKNLRGKAARFDLDYFFDSVVTDPSRLSKLKTEADLQELADWELVRGCMTTGLITEIGFRHLDYIRDMRNWASAAHPNQNELRGLQVVSWLETCIQEVLAKEPAGPVIEVRKLLRSIRQEKLTTDDVTPIAATLPSLPEDLSRSLLRTIFGMYTDAALAADVRSNIKLISKPLWAVCSDETRYEAGLKFATLEANGEVARAKLAREFLDLVDGLSYLPSSRLALEISTALSGLMTAHSGWDNFHNEPTPARMLRGLVPASGEVPPAVVKQYIKTLIMCRVGNGYGYGISLAAQPVYDELIGRFSDKHIYWLIELVADSEFASRLPLGKCSEHYQALAVQLEQKAVNAQLKLALHFIGTFPTNSLHNIRADSRFQQVRKAIIPMR